MIYKENETKQVCSTKKLNESTNYENDINRLDNNISVLERDYILFKTDINNNLKHLTENVILLTKNIDKMYEIEKKILEQSHNDKTHEEKISNIEKKIEWITKLFISTILVIGLKVVYDVNNNINNNNDDKKIVYVEKK